MKTRIGYLFWILILAFGLMILVVATQLLTNKNIKGLKYGNSEAVVTFTINNRLQDLVNLSFELNSKLLQKNLKESSSQSIVDSLAMLSYNAAVLKDINQNKDVVSQFHQLDEYIDLQVKTSMKILQSNASSRLQLSDSLVQLHLTDSIYTVALSIQKYLEKDLETTLGNNTINSGKLSAYNKTLAFIAIGAVLILGTIIINRHLKQVQLIKDLEKATMEARKSAMIKDQFLANMSHEIRTPLNAIKGFSRLISKTQLTSEQKQYSLIINDASSNLMNIVNDILDISKIEAGKLRIEIKEFDLKKVMKTIEYLFVNSVKEKGLTSSYKIENDVPEYVVGDPDRLSQILINLIGNAIKFTTNGFVKTSVSILKQEAGKVWLTFSVEDSGIGIPVESQDQIFQRFEQLKMNKEYVLQGTGLGLSIVKNLVSQMDGTISLSSAKEKGSLFSVTLPLLKATNYNADITKGDDQLLPLYYYTNASVLVVEDNKVNQLLLKHTLASFGIKAEITSNGQEAIEAIRARKFNLMLLDIQMPVMDGYETIKLIRNMGYDLPVIAMTAFVLPGEHKKCIDAGMNDYLAKPVDFKKLANLLELYLKNEQATVEGKTVQKVNRDTFLLELSGGDKMMAERILQEIKDEIPHAESKLKKLIDKANDNEINNLCHYLISTFSPLGSDTEVMKTLQQLKNAQQEDVDVKSNNMLINKLIEELAALETDLSQSRK